MSSNTGNFTSFTPLTLRPNSSTSNVMLIDSAPMSPQRN